MKTILRKLKLRRWVKNKYCVVCGDKNAQWEYPYDKGGFIRLCDWDNAAMQMENRHTVGLGRRVDAS